MKKHDSIIVPNILIVDDDEGANSLEIWNSMEHQGVSTRVRHPEEVIASDLRWADVVLVDYFLIHWNERDSVDSVARAPHNGIAVIATLRSALLPNKEDRMSSGVPDPVAFGLISGNLGEASFELPSAILRHVFSRDNNLDWAFSRDEIGTQDFVEQIAALGRATRLLAKAWEPTEAGARGELTDMLAIEPGDSGEEADESTRQDRQYWQSEALSQVLACHPPIHELGSRSHGMSMIRWLLHRIFPYPSFLLDDRRLFARLGLDFDTKSECGDELSRLFEQLERYRYRGVLAEYPGSRWWRAGIESWLFDSTGGASGDPYAIEKMLSGIGVGRGSLRQPVVVIGADLAQQDQFAEADQVVRVLPDDWPVYADSAYARIVDVLQDDRLLQLVSPLDRETVDDARSSMPGRQ